jgi:hypothetical protein
VAPLDGGDIVSVLLVAVLGLSGCALHASLQPPELDYVYGYGRITHCPGQPIPPQLVPVLIQRPDYVMVDAGPPPCDVTEVGAMDWRNMITAIGTALIGIIPLF